MCAKGKSRIWGAASAGVGFVERLAAKSGILTWLCERYALWESRFSGAWAVGIGSRLSDRCRRAWMVGFENSFLFRLAYRIGVGCLRTSIGTWGCFSLLYGCFAGAALFAAGNIGRGMLALCAGLVALALSALHSSRSLGDALRKSTLLGWFLFDFCGIEWSRFSVGHEGEGHPWIALSTAAMLGSVARFFSPLLCLSLLFCTVCFAVLLAVPPLSICLLFAALPFFNLLSHPTLALLFAVGMLYAVWFRRALCGRCYVRFCLLDFLVLVLAVWYMLSGFGSYGGGAAVASGVTVAAAISVWFPTVSLLRNTVWRRRAAGALSLSCSLCAALGCLQYAFGRAELRWVDTARFSDIGGRVTSVFDNPNVLAVFLLLGVPLLPVVFCSRERRASVRICGILCTGVTLLCLVLTWTRGAWLGALLSCILLLLLYSRGTRTGLLFALFPLASALPLLPHSVKNRFVSIGSLTESSIRYRLYTWRGVLRLLRAEPWGIGAGAEAFSTAYRRYAVSGTETVAHAHNLFLRVACDIGWVGMAVLFITLFLLLLYFIGNRHREKITVSCTEIDVGCFCALCGVLLMGLFDDVWYHNGLAVLFWAVAGMMTAGYEGAEYAEG